MIPKLLMVSRHSPLTAVQGRWLRRHVGKDPVDSDGFPSLCCSSSVWEMLGKIPNVLMGFSSHCSSRKMAPSSRGEIPKGLMGSQFSPLTAGCVVTWSKDPVGFDGCLICVGRSL